MSGAATALGPVFDFARLHDVGRTLDLAGGLAAVLDGLDPRSVAPDGVALLPLAMSVPDARVLPHPFAARDGLMLVRFSEAGQGRGLTGARAAALAAVRIGLLSGLLDMAAHRLAGRRFGGTRLIDQQLVAGAVADVLTELDLAMATAVDTPAEVAAAQHERLTEAGWTVARFFGAEGYLADHPARGLYLSALAADVWLPRPPEWSGEHVRTR